MIDISLVRERPEVLEADLKKRGISLERLREVQRLDKGWRDCLQKADELKHARNLASRGVAELKKAGKDASGKIAEMGSINGGIAELDAKREALKSERDSLLMRLPNILHAGVPVGPENAEMRRWGEPKEKGAWLRPHGELAESLGVADFDKASKVSGAGFNYLKGGLAMLDFALMRFAVDELVKKGYTLVEPPHMMNRAAYEGVTDLGDFESVMYKVEAEDLYMIATSEHPIAAMLMNEVIDESGLPLRLVGISPCYRREIGSRGVDTKGLFRVHQFNKAEQFVFCRPEDSGSIHDEILSNAEELWKKLEIPHRVVDICTGDIGTVAARKYDIEAWSPRQKRYMEVVSASNCTDYQARRLNIRHGKRGGETSLVHTLNSTAIATSRAMVAILENFQNEDGTVAVPKALRPHMGGMETLK